LHKAESTPFLIDMIAKAERSHLQRSLGFNEPGVDNSTLQDAWIQQTGQSTEILSPLIQPPRATKSADQTLNAWLQKLKRIRQTPIR